MQGPVPRVITYQRKRANRRIVNEEGFVRMLREFGEVRDSAPTALRCSRGPSAALWPSRGRLCPLPGAGHHHMLPARGISHCLSLPFGVLFVKIESLPVKAPLHVYRPPEVAQVSMVQGEDAKPLPEQLAALAATGVLVTMQLQ